MDLTEAATTAANEFTALVEQLAKRADDGPALEQLRSLSDGLEARLEAVEPDAVRRHRLRTSLERISTAIEEFLGTGTDGPPHAGLPELKMSGEAGFHQLLQSVRGDLVRRRVRRRT